MNSEAKRIIRIKRQVQTRFNLVLKQIGKLRDEDNSDLYQRAVNDAIENLLDASYIANDHYDEMLVELEGRKEEVRS